MGGTWWSAKPDGSVDKAMVDQPEFKNALQFYVDLVKDAGEKDAAGASFNECLSQYKDGKVAMWYDATVAAGLLEADDSPVKGKNGYAPAPVEQTAASGWLWSWALAIPATSEKADLGWKYISFATGPEYLKEAGSKIPGGWASIPPGTRKSTYEIPEYKKAAAAFAAAHARRDRQRRRSTIRAPRSGRAFRASSTSASRSSRTSATSARSSSPR